MNLHPRRGRPDPAFPIPLHTLLSLPRLQQRGFESPGEERGTEPDDFQWRILLPPRGWSSEGQRCCTGREAGPGAGGWGGSVTHHGAAPGGGSQPCTARAGAGRGKRAGDPRGRGAAARPTPGTPATRNPGPPLHPHPPERGAPPLPVRLGGRGGAEVGIGGRASAQRTGPAIGCVCPAEVRDWLRKPGHCRRVGLGTGLPGLGACFRPPPCGPSEVLY